MNYIKNPKVLIATASVIAVLAIGYVFLQKPTNMDAGSYIVGTQDITEQVSVTGKVKPSQSVELAFDRPARLSTVSVAVGDVVQVGQVLAVESNSDLYAQLAQAQAGVKAAIAMLGQLKQGSKPEQIALNQTSVNNAKATLDGAISSAISRINDAYTVSDDAVRNKVDQLFSNPQSSNPQISFVIANSQLVNSINTERSGIESDLSDWKMNADSVTGSSNIVAAIKYSESKLDGVQSFLSDMSLAVNSLTPSANLSQQTIDTYKSSVSTARTNIATAVSNMIAVENSFNAAAQGLDMANEQLNLAKSGGTVNQITAQEAQVEQAQAGVDNVNTQLAKTIMRSPITGVVTRVDAKVGEIAPVVPVISVITNSKFKLETYFSEADIAKVKAGDLAQVTLDAYPGGEPLGATVLTVDPAETMVNGSAAYKVTLQFNGEDSRIKSGLTANATVYTNSKNGVLAVPEQAIVTRGTNKYVLINQGKGEPSLVKVSTGIFGSNGMVEIVSGLAANQKIISFTGATSTLSQ